MPTPRKLSQKPSQSPTFDEGIFAKRLYERVLTASTNKPYAVFKPDYFPKFVRWVKGSEEYDGTGLRDTVNTNALFLDQIKGDLDGHRDMDNARHATLSTRVAALEAQQGVPFPGSG